MFKLEVTKLDNNVDHVYNMNKKEDDFLRFVIRNYGVPKENLKAYLFEDEKFYELEAYLKLEGNELDISEEGKIKVVNKTTTVDEVTEAEEIEITLVKEYIGTLILYPYSNSGKFLGNGYEL